MAKTITFHGKSAHAGGAPHKGVNALYAANQALNAVNALRETFQDADCVRFHPIITNGGTVVNAIPGIILHIVLIPVIVFALQRAKIIKK